MFKTDTVLYVPPRNKIFDFLLSLTRFFLMSFSTFQLLLCVYVCMCVFDIFWSLRTVGWKRPLDILWEMKAVLYFINTLT